MVPQPKRPCLQVSSIKKWESFISEHNSHIACRVFPYTKASSLNWHLAVHVCSIHCCIWISYLKVWLGKPYLEINLTVILAASTLVSSLTFDKHIPQLLSCLVIQLALSVKALVFCLANSLAWNSSCLPIKTSNTEC